VFTEKREQAMNKHGPIIVKNSSEAHSNLSIHFGGKIGSNFNQQAMYVCPPTSMINNDKKIVSRYVGSRIHYYFLSKTLNIGN
jgi:hypothetical protein